MKISLFCCAALLLSFSPLAQVRAAEMPASKPANDVVTDTTPNDNSNASGKDATSADDKAASASSTPAESRMIPPDTELIDVPTANIVDYGSFSTRSRFFSNGGVLEWLSFGVFQRLNIGASLNVDKLLGTESPVQVTRPDLQVKFRFYDGTPVIPALAVGFDGQGYRYNRVDQRYDQRDRGLYIVGSQEIIVPGLQVHAGMNIPDFNNNPLFGFMGVDYNIEDKVMLMTEWDNINNFDDSRLNAGFRVYITSNFTLDFAVRTIGQGGNYTNGNPRGVERTVAFKYIGNF